MVSKILQVFYDDKCYPFKDQERQVRFPIVGNSFVGASNITAIRFYIDHIGSIFDTWVANTKLPNGKMGNEILSTKGSDIINGVEEHYVELSLSSFYTQAKGDVYISLNGFYGGVEITENDGIYEISGVPTIQATGSIKLSVYYATPLMDGDEVDVITLQQILAEISTKLGKSETKYLKVVPFIGAVNLDSYKDYITSGDVVYAVYQKKFYSISGEYPSYSYTEIELSLGSIVIGNLTVQGTLEVPSFHDIDDAGGNSLDDFIEDKVNYGIAIVFNMTSNPQFLTPSELNLLKSNHNIRILYEGNLYDKAIVEDDQHTYFCIQRSVTTISGYTQLLEYVIALTIANGRLSSGSHVLFSFYNKSQTDTLLNLKADKSDTYTKAQIDEKLTSLLVYKGSLTVDELNAIVDELGESQTGWFYNVTDSGTLEWQDSYSVNQSLDVLAGDNVCWTGDGWDKLTMDLSVYDDKFIAAGFFEVESYDEDDGTITIVYSSELYDMSYDSDTGIMTIEAN